MEFLAGLHPLIVHFPIAFFILYSAAEVAGIAAKKDFAQKFAHIVLFLGVLFSVAAVLTGNQAYESSRTLIGQNQLLLDKIDLHEDFATYSLWFYMALLTGRTYFILKKRMTRAAQYLFALLAIGGAVLIFLTGLYGGELVYKYGIGTNLFGK